jgi:hypothetical protein
MILHYSNRIKEISFITSLMFMSVQAISQDFDDFYEHATDIHIINSSPGYTSFGFQFASGNSGKYKLNLEYTTLMIPDVAIISTLNTLTGKHPDKSPFTNFWGSLAVGINVIANDKLIVTAGVNATDFVFNEKVTTSGYAFYTAGSYARADYLINGKFLLRVRNYVSKSVKNGSRILDMTNSIDGLSPLFIKTGADVIYLSRFVAGAEYITVTSYPGISANRFNLRLGYRFG